MQKNLSSRRQIGWRVPALDPLAAWAAALGLFLLVLALRLEVAPGDRADPFLPFFPLVLVTAWLCGRAPAMTSAAAGTLAAWWFLIRGPGMIGWPRPIEAGALALFLANGLLAAALITGLARTAARAIAERNQAETATAAQQALMAELQHRVSNNLQVVSSALTMQARRLGGGDEAASLRDAVRRLDALARLHRLLVSVGEAPDAVAILEDLCRTQVDASGDGRVALELGLQAGVQLDPDRLTLVGMILSEAISNALKHGFPDGRSGRLAVRLHAKTPARAELEVRDSGAGLPEHFDLSRTDSLGLRIVQSLVQRLHGTLSLATERGAVLRVCFPTGSPDEG